MIQLLIILTASSLLAITFQKKIQQMLPPTVMGTLLTMYAYALFIHNLIICIWLSLGVLILFSIILFFLKKKNISLYDIKKHVLTPQIAVFLVVCIGFIFLFSNRKVFNWDDLSYWGIFSKDLFYLNKLPLGIENCSILYKDYMPIMQLMQFFFLGFQGFTEAGLHQINICFMYLLLLPFLDTLCQHKEKKNQLVIIILFIIFPHIFTTQFYYKLGVDYLISVLFGYGLYMIKYNHFSISRFRQIIIMITSSFLALIKTSGIVLGLFLVLFYIFCTTDTKTESDKITKISTFTKRCLSSIAIPLFFYSSWKFRGIITSNHGYLSDTVDNNIRSLNHAFPPYTKSVVINYIKHFLTYPLTRDRIGITAFIILLCTLVAYLIEKKTTSEDEIRISRRLYRLMMVGLILFCLAHIYMYLFVFDEWEAEGLLEFDRYINQYLAGVFYYYMSSLWHCGTSYQNLRNKKTNPATFFLFLFVALLPYSSINEYLIPQHYTAHYEEYWKPFREAALKEVKDSKINDLHLPYDEDHRLMLVANGFTDKFQYFVYELVPQPITVVANIPAVETGNLHNYISSISDSNNITYMYVMQDIGQDYAGDFFEESKSLTIDQRPLSEGTLYVRTPQDDDVLYQIYK